MGEGGVGSTVSSKASPEYSKEFYKKAYDGYENLSNYTPTELERYRAYLLQKTQLQVDFIVREFQDILPAKIKVIEFCSGNARLLVSLAKRGILERGLGIEISKSRVQFAEKWRQDYRWENFSSVEADALDYESYPPEEFDLVACLTGALQYFYPIDEAAPLKLLRKMRKSLKRRGKILLELYPLTDHKRKMFTFHNGRLRTWEELPSSDTFRFYLSDLTYWQERNILEHNKIFVGRDGSVDEGRVHLVTYYTESQIRELLHEAGFSNTKVFGDFERENYLEASSELMVVVART